MKQRIIFLILLVCAVIQARADVEINETNFPDERFRVWLKDQNYGFDHVITDEEIASITSMSMGSMIIQDLKGIEFFTALTELNCYGNHIETLDVSGVPLLTTLVCSSNYITSLNVSKNAELRYLICSSNQLTSLDLSNNTKLERLECGGNQLTSLDISKNTALTELSCSGNQIASLDASGLTVLTKLDCTLSQIEELNVSGCTSLTEISCFYNKIKDKAMDAFIASLPTVSNGIIKIFSGSSDYEQNIMTTLQAPKIKRKGWTPQYHTGGVYGSWVEYAGSEPIPEGLAINEQNFPDENFRNYILGMSYGKDRVLTDAEIESITSLTVGSKNIQNLKGIEYFTALTSLACQKNQLTSLDVSKNTKLTKLYCYSNQIVGENMDMLLESLPTVSNGTFQVVYGKDDQNIMTYSQVDAAKAKGWNPTYYNNTYNSWYSYIGTDTSTEGLEINSTNFPDDNFREWLLAQIYGWDGVLTDAEIAHVTELSVSGTEIKDLKGIEHFTALEALYCSNNHLTNIDVSKNTMLTNLYCSGNELTTIDLSSNKALLWLNCYDNQISSLDISNSILLRELICYNNHLTSLDLSNNKRLATLACYNNELNALDLSACESLKWLSCYNNHITSLDVSKCSILTYLRCTDNQMTSLISTKNTKFTELYCLRNQIKGEAMDALIASLPTVKDGFLAVMNETDEGNIITMTQIAAVKAKGWIPKESLDGAGWREFPGSDFEDEKTAIDETTFPDANFRNYLLAQKYGKDGILTETEINLVSSMDVSNKGIKSLKGIEHFTALKKLYCQQNQISRSAMDELIDCLPTANSGELYAIFNENEGNMMTPMQVASAKEKNWIPYYYDGSYWQEYAGEKEKCATPVIVNVDGKLMLTCETEDVEYACNLGFKNDGNILSLPKTVTISIYATKEGYEPSDVLTKEIDLKVLLGIIGDVNNDGIVNGTDIQEVINIIVNGE